MNGKFLFLRINTEDMFFKYMKDLSRSNYYIFTPQNIIFKILMKMNLANLMFGKWIKNLNEYKYVILGENYYSFKISKYIKKYNKDIKIIMFFMNTINDDYSYILNDSNIDEFWTFDKEDAIKYNINYNTQFYTNEIISTKTKIDNEVIYLGRDKGRNKILYELKNILDKNNITNNFFIINNEKDCMKYDEYLQLVFKSNCIVDINKENQIGLSLRPLESLFFEKKLITNNLDILNYKFYNSNNIFLLGYDNIHNLKEFVKSPYIPIDEEIVNYYSYKEWLNRFEVKNEF